LEEEEVCFGLCFYFVFFPLFLDEPLL